MNLSRAGEYNFDLDCHNAVDSAVMTVRVNVAP